MRHPNILFVIPPVIPVGDLKNTAGTVIQWATNCSVPLGVLSIASYAGGQTRAQFRILDLNVEIARHFDAFGKQSLDGFLAEQLGRVKMEEAPDVVGISAIFNSNAGYLQPIASAARKTWPNVLVVAGGGFPTAMYEHALALAPDVDAVAIGEGEKPFLGLIKAANRRKYLSSAPAWMTLEKVAAGVRPSPDLVADLDDIPFLRYDLIEFDKYQSRNRYHGEKLPDSKSVSIMTSRGCPYLCNFCASHTVHGRSIRTHSAARVIADIRRLKQDYNVNILLVEDDNFIASKQTALSILKEVAAEEMTIEFPNGLSVMNHDGEIVDAMKAAGVKMATLAVESGSERVLREIIRKPYKNLSAVREAVALYRARGIYVRAFFIIGFPGETREEILESVRFMKETGFNWVAVMIASPIAGSDLYEQCRKENLLATNSVEDFHYGKSTIKLPHSSPEEMEAWRYEINLEVNFVDNYDLRTGHPEQALTGFQDVLNRVPDHAFACYFSAKAYRMMGQPGMADKFMTQYRGIVNESRQWAGYASRFHLGPDAM